MAHCYTKHVECPDISCSECDIKVRKEMINIDTESIDDLQGFKKWGDNYVWFSKKTKNT